MNNSLPRGLWLGALLSGVVLQGGCTSTSKGMEIHTAEISCEEANRTVYDSVQAMRMKVTAFKAARPGVPGLIKAKRGGSDPLSGSVSIVCDETGVHIDPKQHGTSLDQQFERGIFLSVTGRSGLVVDRGKIMGRNPANAGDALVTMPTVRSGEATSGAHPGASVPQSGAGGSDSGKASNRPLAGSSAPVSSAARASSGSVRAQPGSGVRFRLEPIEGFGTVLDFDADISSAGILPIRITVSNGSDRAYDFDPANVHVRVKGSRQRAKPLTADQAVALLQSHPDAADLGDVAGAARIIRSQQMKPGRLQPGDVVHGFAYYPLGNYDRAKATLSDVATGETDGFLVQF